jgi:head-tail adaptor
MATRTKAFILQNETTVTTASGAKKITWTDLKTIQVSISQINETRLYQSVKYQESTHSGITYSKGIKAGKNRLKDSNGEIYEILSAAGDYRMTNLLLKKVET